MKILKIIPDELTFGFAIASVCYCIMAGIIHIANLSEIIQIKANENLCEMLTDKNIHDVEEYRLWDSILIFDLFVPDMVNDINIDKCKINN